MRDIHGRNSGAKRWRDGVKVNTGKVVAENGTDGLRLFGDSDESEMGTILLSDNNVEVNGKNLTLTVRDDCFVDSEMIEWDVRNRFSVYAPDIELDGPVRANQGMVVTGNLLVNGVDLAETGLDSVLSTLIKSQQFRLKFADQLERKYPLTPLVSNADSRVFSTRSSNTNTINWQAFDGVYGTNAIAAYPDARYKGWFSGEKTDILIDAVSKKGSWIYLDLSQDSTTVMISSFQFYCVDEGFPIEYNFIVSNDAVNWKSLHNTTQLKKEAIYPHNSFPGAYSYKIPVVADKYYRYAGMYIKTSGAIDDAGVLQELLIYGVE